MRKPSHIVAVLVLALWGLASMHCKLEALPGLEFLKVCCFVDSPLSGTNDCEKDGCADVEDGTYRAEEQAASAPQPLLVLAWASLVAEVARQELQPVGVDFALPPPELPAAWQFSRRAALLPRAPSLLS